MSAKELLRSWIDAFNGKNIEGLIRLYHVKAVNFQVAVGEPSVGTEKIEADFREFFQGFPDSYAKIENLISDGDWAAWEWFGGGTFAGPFLGIEPTNKSYKLRGCGFFNFSDEKIILQRGYWDKQTWFSQVGIDL